jgi:hypothetical protein
MTKKNYVKGEFIFEDNLKTEGKFIGDGSELTDLPNPDLTDYVKVDGSNMPITGKISNYNPEIPDMGYIETSDLRGYGEDYIADKAITHSSIGYNTNTIDGGIRYYLGEVQSYRGGSWNTLLAGIQIVTDETEIPLDVEITDFDYILSLITGDSDEKDFNGLPLVQQMHLSMGIYATPQILNGGTF